MEILLMTVFVLKHFIVDFLLQTKYQYSNKGIYLHFGGILHSFLHFLSTFFILYLFVNFYNLNINYSIVFLSLIDFLIHYHVDYLKVKINTKYNLKPDNSEKYWYLLGLDQTLHLLTYLLIIFLLV